MIEPVKLLLILALAMAIGSALCGCANTNSMGFN